MKRLLLYMDWMKRAKLCFILFFLTTYSLSLFAQALPDSAGFTNKAEAKNLMVNGLKEGKWCEYLGYPHYRLTIYKEGAPYGIVRAYNKSDTLHYEIPYQNGKRNGIAKYYYEYGSHSLKYSLPYSDDKINGIAKVYYTNGKLKSETTYINGTKGATKSYDENGKEIKK